MASNSKLEAGLTPVQTVDVNGRTTTVYKNLNTDTDTSAVPSSLKTKRFGDDGEFRPKSMTVTSMSAANKTIDEIEDDPDLLHDADMQARVADSMTLMSAQLSAERDHKNALKHEIIGMYTEKQVAAEDPKWDAEGRAYVQVVDEQNVFNVGRAQLTNKEIVNCSESALDHHEIRKQFPETWEEIGSCTGNAYVALDTDTDAYRWNKSNAADRLKKADEKHIDGRRKQADVVSALRRSMDRLEKLEENYSRARGVLAEASLGSDDRDEIASKTVAGGHKVIAEIYGDEPMGNHKSGTSYRFKPNEKHDPSKFREARESHYMDVLSQRNVNDSEEKLQRKARTRSAADWAKVSTLKVRADKVKKLYPKKYEKGRTERVLYLEG